jgi:zinc protease
MVGRGLGFWRDVVLRVWRLLASALFLVGGLGVASPSGALAQAFNARHFALANGLEVVVVTDRRAPVVTQLLYYRVGAADEPPGKGGIAHFLEHLMFKGTESVPPGEFSRTVARHGGRENAFTGHDYTGYHQTIARDRLELMMRLEADRMMGLKLDPAQVASERLVVLEERRQTTDNNPGAQFGEQMAAAQYLAHSYRLPVIGWEHEIAALSREDAFAFYRRHYAPNNAVLVLAGDIDEAEARPLVEKYYGALPRRELAPRFRPAEPPQRAPRRVVFEDARVQEPRWSRTYLAPSYTSGAKEHATALSVVADLLGGGQTARLYRELVVARKLATSASAYYGGSSRDFGRFGISATPAPGVALAALEAAVEEILAELLAKGAAADELERARAGLLAGAIYARDSATQTARLFGAALIVGLTVEHVQAWPERVKATTLEQVDAAARAVLVPESSVTGLLLPKAKRAPS